MHAILERGRMSRTRQSCADRHPLVRRSVKIGLKELARLQRQRRGVLSVRRRVGGSQIEQHHRALFRRVRRELAECLLQPVHRRAVTVGKQVRIASERSQPTAIVEAQPARRRHPAPQFRFPAQRTGRGRVYPQAPWRASGSGTVIAPDSRRENSPGEVSQGRAASTSSVARCTRRSAVSVPTRVIRRPAPSPATRGIGPDRRGHGTPSGQPCGNGRAQPTLLPALAAHQGITSPEFGPRVWPT
jgi:hypothetical protein